MVKYGMIRLYALGPFRLSPVGKVGSVGLFLSSTPSYQTWLSGSLPNPLETLLGTQWWMYSFSKYLRDKIRDILKTKRWSWMFACHCRFNHANLINCLRVKKPTLLESVCFPSYLCGPCLNPKPGVKCGPSFHVTVSHPYSKICQ